MRAPLLAGASGALLAAAWQLSSGSLAAPLAAQACVLTLALTLTLALALTLACVLVEPYH